MAQSFPMPLATFFAGLGIASITQDLTEAMEYARTEGGAVTTADLGPRLWQTSITINPDYHADIAAIKARLNLLRQAGRSLLVGSSPIEYPRNDPGGVILGAANVQIKSVAGNNRDLTLKGLPLGYKLTYGDVLSFTYGSNPIRYAMHQIASEATANALGELTVEVVDFIRPGAIENTAVVLKKPYHKAVILPGSTQPGAARHVISEGVTFGLIQTLR